MALVAAADAGNPAAAPYRTLHALGWYCNGERRLWAGERRSSPRVRLSGAIQSPSAGRTAPRAGLCNGKSSGGGWSRAQLAQGIIWALLLRVGDGEDVGQRSRASGQVFSYRPDGNRVATSSVRPTAVTDGLPERGEPAAPLLMFNSYAAGVVKRPELVAVSSRGVKVAKQVEPLRQMDPMGEGIRVAVLFL